MTIYRIAVEIADGDDWTSPRRALEIDVEAATETEAKLVASQVAMARDGHVQITRVRAYA